MLKKGGYKKTIILIVVLAILIRLFLLYFAPVSMFSDGLIRYIPDAEKVLRGDFSFKDVPLFIMFEAFWMLLFKGKILWLAWKTTSFIFFIGILFLLPSLFKKLNLGKNERLIILSLLLFSTWSLLLSVTVLQDMMLTFFVLALFLSIENYFEKHAKGWVFLSIFLAVCMIFTKMTGYFILAGFFLYILAKSKIKIKERIKFIIWLGLGSSLTLLWMIKNYINTSMLYVLSVAPSSYLHSFSEYMAYFVRMHSYFWEIPVPSEVELTGIFSLLYNFYFIGALIITIALSLLIIFALIKYGKKYKDYLLLMAPLWVFVFYCAFIMFWGPHDIGRYTFPLWLFLFLFPVKLISNIKNNTRKKKTRNLICIIVAVGIATFCLVSTASAFGITLHMKNIDNQVLQISSVLKEQGATGTFRANDEFTACTLSFYFGESIKFKSTGGTRDKSLKCEGEQIFKSRNYVVYKENSEYRICRK